MDFKFFLQEIVIIPAMIILFSGLTAFLRASIQPERMKSALARVQGPFGYLIGSLLGAITPFCSCASVPIFMGIAQLRSTDKAGAAFSFLITSPLVNEVAFVMIWQLFGANIALFYLSFSLILGILGGWLADLLGMGKELIGSGENMPSIYMRSVKHRLQYALWDSTQILKKTMPMLLVGILIGSWLHNREIPNLEAILLNSHGWWAVILATLVGIPLYSSIAVGIPIAFGLINQGLALGTGMAFLLAVAGLSLPELVMLKGVMSKKLLVAFTTYVAMGIMGAGYVLNLSFL